MMRISGISGVGNGVRTYNLCRGYRVDING